MTGQTEGLLMSADPKLSHCNSSPSMLTETKRVQATSLKLARLEEGARTDIGLKVAPML